MRLSMQIQYTVSKTEVILLGERRQVYGFQHVFMDLQGSLLIRPFHAKSLFKNYENSRPKGPSMTHRSILQEGKNCWRIGKAKRLSFLIDADAYYRAFVKAVDHARHTVYISGWDIDSRVRLIRSTKNDTPHNISLGAYLNQKAIETPNLNIYILCWDFSFIYALEREWFSSVKFEWQAHACLPFRLDDDHPAVASHHQKFVVVDDSLSFCGGIDLTKDRWGTSQHHRRDSRRVDPDGRSYTAFHDVQIAADGDVAADLGALFRKRWAYATGQHLVPVEGKTEIDWPHNSDPDLNNVCTTLARTYPA